MMELRIIKGFLSAVPSPMLALDRRARVVAANAAAQALFGQAVTDRPFVAVIRNPGVNQAVEAVLRPEEAPAPPPDPTLTPVDSGGLRLRVMLAVAGRELPCTVTVSPLPAGLGGMGALVLVEDSTGVEEAEDMRRDFVANVSHELRTPLTALMGFIETLQGPARNDPEARDRFLAIMAREASRMNRLVADLLSLSSVEAQERRRPLDPVDLASLVRGTAATMSAQAKTAGVDIEVEGADAPCHVPGDADQLVQVMNNLVENAIKYGGTGGQIGLRLYEIPHEPRLRGPARAIEVWDLGEGIDELHLPRLTERFYRVDSHRSREMGGTGLGLAIVKHILNRHRGRLRVDSVRGEGTRFTVLLPAAAAH